MRDVADSAVGYILALAGFGFGVVGFVTGLVGHGDSAVWFLSAAILAILGVGIVLDESRLRTDAPSKIIETSLGWLLTALAFGVGVVGFIAGLMLGGGHSREWLFGAIILALIAVAVIADEGRRLRAGRQGVTDEILGSLLSALALGLGIVGFILGIMGNGFGNTWLFAGVISGITAVAFMFDGERRAAIAAIREQRPTELDQRGGEYRQPFAP